ncbi:MAG: aromatic ring-hydroxylating dioxygenase subunit alpha [Pseudomonadota bacterium]
MRDEFLLETHLTEALRSVLKVVDEANGLPNWCYTSENGFIAERDTVFSSTWTAIGFAHQVAEKGMAVPVTFMGLPLLMIGGRDGEVSVYQNVCRHRGMILLEEPTLLKTTITCPYHGWCYGIDGRLRGTPHVGGPGENAHPVIERPDLGLIPVRSHVFMGVVFVNLDGNAPSFDEATAGLRSQWSDFVDRPITFGGDDSFFRLELETNWKLAVENYCESYHLPWVHPSLNTYSRLEDHYNILDDDFSGQGTLVYNPVLSEDGRAFPLFDDLPDKWDTAAEYIALYPNALLGVHKDHTFAIVIEPISPSKSVEHIALFYPDEAAAGDDHADLRATNTDLWKTVFKEDIFVVEGMQRGRAARDFDGGRFSPPMDCATHAFHAWVAKRLLDGMVQ